MFNFLKCPEKGNCSNCDRITFSHECCNCDDCIDCHGCSNCDDCRKCTDCSNCDDQTNGYCLTNVG